MPPTSSTTLLELTGYAERAADEATRSVDYVCSTESIDAHGTKLKQNWDLTRYSNNPVVLYCHDRRSMPIGLASNVRVENNQLKARVTFATAEINPDAERCWKAVQAGLLRGISAGFRAESHRWEKENDQDIFVLDELELHELSVCPVPSNADALVQREAIFHLRAQALAQRTPQEFSTMNEQEAKALREALAARDAEVTKLSNEAATQRAAHEQSFAKWQQDLAAREAQLAAREAQLDEQKSIATKFCNEADQLKQQLEEQQKRSHELEAKMIRSSIEQQLGVNVDPAEVDDLVQLHRVSPELFQRTLDRRRGRNDKLTQQVIPSSVPEQQRSTPDVVQNFLSLVQAQGAALWQPERTSTSTVRLSKPTKSKHRASLPSGFR